MSLFSNWNGKIVENNKICISPDNRSFRYGDGCFETIKVINGEVLLADLHFQRLFSSLVILKFFIPTYFTSEYLTSGIEELVTKNGHSDFARVRLVVYRGDGALYDLEDKNPYFIIQSWSGKVETNFYNDTGLNVGIFSDAKKSADLFSAIKSNNYLPYAMAAMSARENALDDCILTNAFNRIVDATIANVFILSDGIIKTPSLTEGCVSGVMRKYLLNCFASEGMAHSETQITQEELLSASEVFLTNANYGVRWVRKIGSAVYFNAISSLIHKSFIAPLFGPATF
jgi:branched-chain amino acid aminotransferase